jgi:hypothetical protein
MTAATLLLLATLAPAWAPYTTSVGATVHWDTATFCYEVGDNVPEAWPVADVEALVQGSLEAWTTLACAPKVLRYDGRVDERAVDPATGSGTTLVWIDAAANWRWSPTAYAMTTLTARRSDGVILDADLEVNVGGHDFSLTDECPVDRVDLRNTLTHEAGHLMGLDHSQEPEATLFGAADPGTTFMRDLSDDDVAGYCWLAATFPPTEQVAPCAPPGPDQAGLEVVEEPDVLLADEARAESGEVTEGEGGAGGCGMGNGGRGGALAVGFVLLALLSRAGSRTRP